MYFKMDLQNMVLCAVFAMLLELQSSHIQHLIRRCKFCMLLDDTIGGRLKETDLTEGL